MKSLLILTAIILSSSASLAQTSMTDDPHFGTTAANPKDPRCADYRKAMEGEKMPDKPTMYEFTVKTDGSLADIVIKSSSGNDNLDRLGAVCIEAHWRYKPAMQDGKPVERPWRANIIWAQMAK